MTAALTPAPMSTSGPCSSFRRRKHLGQRRLSPAGSWRHRRWSGPYQYPVWRRHDRFRTKSQETSMQRCSVTGLSPQASSNWAMAGLSSAPSGVSAPMTKPSAPASRKRLDLVRTAGRSRPLCKGSHPPGGASGSAPAGCISALICRSSSGVRASGRPRPSALQNSSRSAPPGLRGARRGQAVHTDFQQVFVMVIILPVVLLIVT